MAKKKHSRIRGFFNISWWLDYPRLKGHAQGIAEWVKFNFTSQTPKRRESFQNATKRFDLSNEDLENQRKVFLSLAILLASIAIGVIAYGVRLLIDRHFFSGALCFSISLVALTYAFKYHFWAFQIKQQKLGCTFKEWFYIGLLGRKG